jgi:hypothetical protein
VKMKLPARRPTKISPPPYDVARSVVDPIAHPVAGMAAKTMFFTGIRVGECLALLWDDIDLTARTLTISKSIDHCTGTVIAPKSKKAYRTVPIPNELAAAFLDYRDAQTIGAADRGDPWLFPSAHVAGRVRPTLSYEDLTKLHWNPARQLVTDARVTLHMLRHLYASRLIATGTALTSVAHLLGHYEWLHFGAVPPLPRDGGERPPRLLRRGQEARARRSFPLPVRLGVCAPEKFGALLFDMGREFFDLGVALADSSDPRVETLASGCTCEVGGPVSEL